MPEQNPSGKDSSDGRARGTVVKNDVQVLGGRTDWKERATDQERWQATCMPERS